MTPTYHVVYYHDGPGDRPLAFQRFYDVGAFAGFLLTGIFIHALFVT
jgi:hypothetical protein